MTQLTTQPDSPTVRAAGFGDLFPLAHLFDQYRIFYSQPSAPDAAMAFVQSLLSAGATRFFLAFDANGSANGEPAAPLGFVHLMPSTNTLAMRPIWFLEDLFVAPAARRRGVATALMRYAEDFARHSGAERITLSTAHDNTAAQAVYRRLGYTPEEHFRQFHFVFG